MRFSIVTPSFNSSRWLRLCLPSVADQTGVTHEHIVQDSCSTDGTVGWLRSDPRVTAIIEKDSGMYDAVNRGWQRARGELLAYLNCDEEYLPGTLARVSEFFAAHPAVDVVFGDTIVVDPQGGYICERRALVPLDWHTRVTGSLSYLTAGVFLRRRAVQERGLTFDASLRDVGDAVWTLRLIGEGLRLARLGEFTSVFFETGSNMSLGANAGRERRAYHAAQPRWLHVLRPAIMAHHRWRRWRAAHYRCQPHRYAIYTEASPDRRQSFEVASPTWRWTRYQPPVAG